MRPFTPADLDAVAVIAERVGGPMTDAARAFALSEQYVVGMWEGGGIAVSRTASLATFPREQITPALREGYCIWRDWRGALGARPDWLALRRALRPEMGD
jgi:hypothetical protein